MTVQEVHLATSMKPHVAMLNEIQRLRDVLVGCRDLEFSDLSAVPDEMLREATNHLCEIRELAGDISEAIAFQVANNELAGLEVEDAPEPVSEPEPPGGQQPVETRANAAARLTEAYASMCRRIRNRDRETQADETYRGELFAAFDAALTNLAEVDRACLAEREREHQGHVRRVHGQVSGMLKSWGLPELPAPESYLRPIPSGP
jgi:hypothetical protein